ncbi:MAG: hypothetical protein ABIQ73_25385 [Acidimicrobiales bacterium]
MPDSRRFVPVRTLAAWLAALFVVVLIAATFPVAAFARYDRTAPREQVTGAAQTHVVAPNSTSPALTPIRRFVSRSGTSLLRPSTENALLRILSVVLAALSVFAWQRGYVAGRRERVAPSADHSGSVYFVRGPPSCSSRYPTAAAVGDRLMHTMREDSNNAIRYRAVGRAPWGARVTC